jgi:hypothetical protein
VAIYHRAISKNRELGSAPDPATAQKYSPLPNGLRPSPPARPNSFQFSRDPAATARPEAEKSMLPTLAILLHG